MLKQSSFPPYSKWRHNSAAVNGELAAYELCTKPITPAIIDTVKADNRAPKIECYEDSDPRLQG